MSRTKTMAKMRGNKRIGCLLALVVIGTAMLVFRSADRVTHIEDDFGGYWTASYLLSYGENPCDADNVLEVTRDHFAPDREWAMMAWNPPTLWVFLLPLARLPFQTARAAWLVVNLGLLISSCFLLHQLYCPDDSLRTLIVICVVAVSFAPVLVAIRYGQVVFLILFGVAAALLLMDRDSWFAAGVILILTTAKPHLVILSLPYLMLHSAALRKWQLWAGFVTAGLFCGGILFWLRPMWVVDYSAYFRAPPVDWLTPTLGGVLRTRGLGRWVQFTGLGMLALVPFFVRDTAGFQREGVTALLTVLTIPTTFFGWSYDQSLLLVPAAQMVGWMSLPGVARGHRLLVGLLGTAIIAGSTVHRTSATSEIEYFWVPLAVGTVYGLTWVITDRQRNA